MRTKVQKLKTELANLIEKKSTSKTKLRPENVEIAISQVNFWQID